MNYSVENLHTFCEIARPSYTLVLLVKPKGAQSQFKQWNFAVSRIKMRGHQQYICGGKARNGAKNLKILNQAYLSNRWPSYFLSYHGTTISNAD